jgi:hypothetical protein
LRTLLTAAELVALHGDAYAPVFERIEEELHNLRRRISAADHARQIAARTLAPAGGQKIACLTTPCVSLGRGRQSKPMICEDYWRHCCERGNGGLEARLNLGSINHCCFASAFGKCLRHRCFIELKQLRTRNAK